MDRRTLLQASWMSITGCLLTNSRAGQDAVGTSDPPPSPMADRIALFTDHLDDFGYSLTEVAGMMAPLKISGPDLTVRAGGLVAPDRVIDDLPAAAAAFHERGMSIPMISTTLTSAADPQARSVLSTMSRLGIQFFKLGYLHYHDVTHWETELVQARSQLSGLIQLAQEYKVQAGFHNHAGAGIGGAFWDAWELLQPLSPQAVGFYYDPSHASIEGARFSWQLNLQRVAPRLKMVALKDYVWEKTSAGWRTRWVPLGEGMVDWTEFFRQLAGIRFDGPLSVHIEYDPGGSTRPERIDNSLAAAERDIAFVRHHLEKASAA